MRMKVHAKGQVVIPAEMRKRLGIDVGDVLEVDVVDDEGKIELRRPRGSKARDLAGSLSSSVRKRRFPSEEQIAQALRQALSDDG